MEGFQLQKEEVGLSFQKEAHLDLEILDVVVVCLLEKALYLDVVWVVEAVGRGRRKKYQNN
jgi:hypothetical protein